MKGYSYHSCFIAGDTEVAQKLRRQKTQRGTDPLSFVYIYIYIYIYIFFFFLRGGRGCAGLSCSMQDLHCLVALQNVRS